MILKQINCQYQIETANPKGWLDKHRGNKLVVMLGSPNLLAEETFEGKVKENVFIWI